MKRKSNVILYFYLCIKSTLGTMACESTPCFNNGTCRYVGGAEEFTCDCSTGFVGDRCQFQSRFVMRMCVYVTVWMCVRAWMRVCACMRVCVCACVRACVRMRVVVVGGGRGCVWWGHASLCARRYLCGCVFARVRIYVHDACM